MKPNPENCPTCGAATEREDFVTSCPNNCEGSYFLDADGLREDVEQGL